MPVVMLKIILTTLIVIFLYLKINNICKHIHFIVFLVWNYSVALRSEILFNPVCSNLNPPLLINSSNSTVSISSAEFKSESMISIIIYYIQDWIKIERI